LDANELKGLLEGLNLSDKDVKKLLVLYDSKQSKVNINFKEFIQLIEHLREAVLRGLTRDTHRLMVYYQIGWFCCLCSAGLSFLPFCCFKRQMAQRTQRGHQIRKEIEHVKTPVSSRTAAAAAAAGNNSEAAV